MFFSQTSLHYFFLCLCDWPFPSKLRHNEFGLLFYQTIQCRLGKKICSRAWSPAIYSRSAVTVIISAPVSHAIMSYNAILSGGQYCICNHVCWTVLHMQSCPPRRCCIIINCVRPDTVAYYAKTVLAVN